ncbi:MAG TPA: hypothetical protein DCZ95_02225 [Verrucomicrobia bacterium]|nr:MAG: hypothetical protein A2X46_00620 [Lentisphaerae bacterium GWF2_57_35]HBA82888.1 hypothetical protein [Verrucomicrobiota bacterium]
MKQYLLIPLISAALAAIAAWGVVSWQAVSEVDPVHDEAWLSRKLELSEQQREQLKVISAAYRANMIECMSLQCAARCQMGGRVFEPGVAEVELEPAMEKSVQALLEAERATLRHFRKIHSILTPEQQAKFEPMIRKCICGTMSEGSACAKPQEVGDKP